MIDNLMVELSGTDEALSKNQRVFLMRIHRKNNRITTKDNSRCEYSDQWLTHVKPYSANDKNLLKQSIEFYTAHLLLEAVETIFYTAKFLECGNSFIFSQDSVKEKIEAVCKYTGSDYDEKLWGNVLRRTAV
ncbi:hypothetical protein ACPUVO_09130 [Pseudocolwellia sp. HL-MZ19]|uniref:hypothetical protein n=1 Tax=Pseudocolwellia sp. HL-MZ19 TaxID=3400846 RepID=UPI003CF466FF